MYIFSSSQFNSVSAKGKHQKRTWISFCEIKHYIHIEMQNNTNKVTHLNGKQNSINLFNGTTIQKQRKIANFVIEY